MIGNLTRSWRSLQDRLLHPASESPEYREVQQKLFRDRLEICFWIALVCWTIVVLIDFAEVYNPEFSQRVIENFGQSRLKLYRDRTIYIYSIVAIAWCIFGYRFRKDRFKDHTKLIFLGIAWSLTLFPLLIGSFMGQPNIYMVDYWGSIFLALAILIPVGWRIHLITHLGLIVYYFGAIPFLARLSLIEADVTHIFDTETLVPFLMACQIAILAILMYERSQRQEFESRRELKVFLHSVTHDLKTPVMASSIVLDNILQQPGEEITINRSILERLHQGSDRTYKIVDSLIEAHSTEVNGIKLNPQPCRIQDLVDSVLIDLQPALLQHQAEVKNCLHDNLPDIWADPTQLWRVLNNLIGNALKHNPNGVQITIDATADNDYLCLSISDNGIGISTELKDRLFKLYSRGKRSRYMPGLGIGLYLSQQIITAHGGEIGVISSLGNSSSFWFTVPVNQDRYSHVKQ